MTTLYQSSNFSILTIKRALEKYLRECTTKKLGRFLIQQYEIQFLLFHLIVLKIAQKDYCSIICHKKNERKISELEGKTLGQLIVKFNQQYPKNSLESKLDNYNSKRKNIVHHQEFFLVFNNFEIDELESLKSLEETIDNALHEGEKIKVKLISFLLKDPNFLRLGEGLEIAKNILKKINQL